jgi:hypothetical protein
MKSLRWLFTENVAGVLPGEPSSFLFNHLPKGDFSCHEKRSTASGILAGNSIRKRGENSIFSRVQRL